MKILTFNRNSWHFRLASVYVIGMWEETYNICGYIRSVFRGFLMAIAIAILSSTLLASAFVVPLISLFTGNGIVPDGHLNYLILAEFVFFWVMVSAIVIGFILQIIADVYRNWRYTRRRKMSLEIDRTEKQPGFLKIAYQSFKDKTCILIKFE